MLIDPIDLLGKWTLTFAEAYFNIVNSAAFHASSKYQQDEILEVNELYMKNAYYEFKKDTVYWTDVNARKKEVVSKKGKWMIIGDTLRIFDYDKIYTYNFLVELDQKTDEFNLRMIFPNNDIARGKNTYKKD